MIAYSAGRSSSVHFRIIASSTNIRHGRRGGGALTLHVSAFAIASESTLTRAGTRQVFAQKEAKVIPPIAEIVEKFMAATAVIPHNLDVLVLIAHGSFDHIDAP